MFTFKLPEHGNLKFTAHNKSEFHDFRNDAVFDKYPNQKKGYSNKIKKRIAESDYILPGDVVLESCWWYETRPYYGLMIVVIDENGKKTTDHFGDRFGDIKAGSLYKILLKHNPDFFEDVQESISSCVGRYSSMTEEIREIIKYYEEDYGKKSPGIPVNKYKLDGTFVRKFKSLKSAAKSLWRANPSHLHNAIKSGDGIYKNYKWSLA